jgi:hypothetical protein
MALAAAANTGAASSGEGRIVQRDGGGVGGAGLLLDGVPIGSGQPGIGERLGGGLGLRHDHLDGAGFRLAEIGLVRGVIGLRIVVAHRDVLRDTLRRQDHHLDPAILRRAVIVGVVVVLPLQLLVRRGGRLGGGGEGQRHQVGGAGLALEGEHQAVHQVGRVAAGAHRLGHLALGQVGAHQTQVARLGVVVIAQHGVERRAVELPVRPLEGAGLERGPA